MMASESLGNPSPMSIISSTFQISINHSKLKDLPAGTCIQSPTFTAGGYDWALNYYPQVSDPANKASYVSLVLVVKSEAEDVTALYQTSLQEKNGMFTTYQSQVHRFSSNMEATDSVNYISKDTIEKLCCKNDMFVISCKIIEISKPRVVQNHHGGLGEHIEKLWEKGEGFDVTFDVEGESISAHKLILAARSLVFQAKFYGPMAEAKMECIKIDEMKVDVFKALLHFLYIDKIGIDESIEEETQVEMLQDLFAAADRYAVEKLALFCEKQLAKKVSVDTVLTTLLLADKHSCAGLKKKCLDFVSNPLNLSQVAVTEKYLQLMSGAPLLFAELTENLNFLPHRAKKQKTG